jgi:hypothetical protein
VTQSRLIGWRYIVATWGPMAVVDAVCGVQWLVTSPGEFTFVEFRLALLVAVPCLVTTLSAWWVNAGPRVIDPDRD